MESRTTTLAHHEDHQVGLYAALGDLTALVRDRIADALGAGDAAVLLFTPARREVVADRLRDEGLDLDGLLDEGRLALPDTEEVLGAIVVDGAFASERFLDLLVPAWGTMRPAPGRRVHVVTDIADMAWRDHGRSVAEGIETVADGFIGGRGGTLLCMYRADLLDVPDERTVGTIAGHGGACITRARSQLDKAAMEAFDALFDATTRQGLQLGDDPTGADGLTERLTFWVRQNRRGSLEAFLEEARARFMALRD